MVRPSALVQKWRRRSSQDSGEDNEIPAPRKKSIFSLKNLDEVVIEHVKLKPEDRRTSIFCLPAELLIGIASQLSLGCLCSLRASSRACNELVDDSGIIRYWIHFKLSDVQTSLYPPPTRLTFQYLLLQQRNLNVARHLAALLVEYVEKRILRYTAPIAHGHYEFRPVSMRLREKMIPLLLTINHYLGQCRIAVLEQCLQRQPDATWSSAYAERERKILEGYEPERLLEAHKMWLFLMWVFNQVLNRPSYVGTVERAVRGWIIDPLKPHELTRVLVIGGLRPAKQLIPSKTYKESRKAVETALRYLDPDRNVLWQQYWRALGLCPKEMPTREQAQYALKTKLLPSQVWADSARAVLNERGQLEDSERAVGTPRQTIDFLNGIAGYDILHDWPPDARA